MTLSGKEGILPMNLESCSVGGRRIVRLNRVCERRRTRYRAVGSLGDVAEVRVDTAMP